MRSFLVYISFFTIATLSAQQNNTYQFSLDLTKVHEDLLTVELVTPKIMTDSAVYSLPAIVPGTYKVYNFGRFTSNFHATDKNGKELEVLRLNANSYSIHKAQQLYKITYDVEDCWDTKQKNNFVFEPAGSNIEDSNFVINNHCFFGYFDNMKKVEYHVNITHPQQMFGATGLNNVVREGNTDKYTIANYNDLVDGPIMYCRPDTTHLNIGGSDILISVYSPKGLVSSHFVGDSLEGILHAQAAYLGGTLPIKNYAFIIYLCGSPRGFNSGSYGALEHSYSSMYTLIEQKPEAIAQTIKDVAAHEFFHIVTPLNIHSYEIGDFDYNNPKMSQHLWMYEGLTEYAAHHVQVKYGNMSMENFFAEMSEKISRASQFDDEMPFTEMSKNCLGKTENQYLNVYQKGALIAMCLDLKLRYLSGGTYGTQDRSFVDDSLISDIVKLTYPEIGTFFSKYVTGGEPLPFAECLGYAGIEYAKRKTLTTFDPLGGYGWYLDSNKRVILYPNTPTEFGKDMGFMKGDVLVSLDGKKIKPETAEKQIADIEATMKEGSKVDAVVMRKNSEGKEVKVELIAAMKPTVRTEKNFIGPLPNPTPEQLKIRKAWINK